MKVRYLGHSAAVVSANGLEFGIDPWLKGNPSCPKGAEDTKIDVIVLTHGHADHASDVVRLAALHGSTVVATYELACILREEGVREEKLVYMNTGGSTEIGKVKITLTPALHSNSYDTKSRGTLYAGQPCGVVLEDGKSSIYHAGDTALFSDMRLIGQRHELDLALLPIGDRFTMGVQDAALAASFLGVKQVIPIHHSTFPLLHGSPEAFIEACKPHKVKVFALKPGESMEVFSEA